MSYSFKRQKSVSIFNAFQSILNDSKRKPNKTWVDSDVNNDRSSDMSDRFYVTVGHLKI